VRTSEHIRLLIFHQSHVLRRLQAKDPSLGRLDLGLRNNVGDEPSLRVSFVFFSFKLFCSFYRFRTKGGGSRFREESSATGWQVQNCPVREMKEVVVFEHSFVVEHLPISRHISGGTVESLPVRLCLLYRSRCMTQPSSVGTVSSVNSFMYPRLEGCGIAHVCQRNLDTERSDVV
jgi:hypothetical protein